MKSLKRAQPPLSIIEAGSFPDVEKARLGNGIPVFIIEAGTEDILRLEFVFRAGQVKEYLPLLASTTNLMLTEGSETYSAEKLNRELDFHGAFVNLSAEKDTASVVILCLARHLGKILDLSGEILFRPVFPEKELNNLMKKRLRWFLNSREKVTLLSLDQFFETIFGKNHPYGRQALAADFDLRSAELLRDFHSMHYTPDEMTIIVSGKIPGDTLKMMDRRFGNVERNYIYVEDPCSILKSSSERKVHIIKPEAVQTSVRIGSVTINKRHSDYFGLKIVDTILGGYFGSRLMKNIREDKGLTYGIYSAVTSFDLAGYKLISTEVSPLNVRRTIDEIYREISLIQTEPVKETEMDVVRNYMSGELIRMFDGPFALAESFKSIWDFGLGVEYFSKFAEKIRKITPEEIMSLARIYYNIDEMYEITAG